MKDIQSISHETKEKAQNICGIKIVSIAIFGSTARRENHADSDVDLLVIAEGIAKKRIQRIPDIVKIKRELNLGFPLDILSILQDKTVAREVNLHALHNFLSLNYIPHPDTIFKGIYKLPQGHILTCDGEGRIEIKEYWDVRFGMGGWKDGRKVGLFL